MPRACITMSPVRGDISCANRNASARFEPAFDLVDGSSRAVRHHQLSRAVSRWLLLAEGLHALLVKHFKIYFGQMNRRKSGPCDRVRDIGAQVRVNDVRAADAEQRIKLFLRDVTRLENAGLLALDQERNLVLDFGGDGNGDGRFEDPFRQGLGADIDRNFDRRRILLEENTWRIRLLQRQVLQIDALDLEYGLLDFVRHEALSLG